MANKKFLLLCNNCGQEIEDFSLWFENGQRCFSCGSNQSEVKYLDNYKKLMNSIKKENDQGIWDYYEYLPLNNKKNIISFNEGSVPIERWGSLESRIKDVFNINCKIYAHRQDANYATGTFKDLAGSVVASVLKKNEIPSYVVASTGNIGVAYARYLSAAKITLYAFIPRISPIVQEAELSCFGQKVFRVDGDYSEAKNLAMEFAQENNILLSAGNFDPMRIEAKKTMVFEWLRKIDEFPTVYFQALSGGTGPLGIEKGCRELKEAGHKLPTPRYILVQSNKCSPMADAWETAKNHNFPEGWENEYPIYNNPETEITTLATGYPKTYPVLSKIVRDSKGEIIDFNEESVVDVARFLAFEFALRTGPAGAITVGGFLKSVSKGHVKDGDVVLLNIGEGIRRSPAFLEKLLIEQSLVKTVDQCGLFSRDEYGDNLWEKLIDVVK